MERGVGRGAETLVEASVRLAWSRGNFVIWMPRGWLTGNCRNNLPKDGGGFGNACNAVWWETSTPRCISIGVCHVYLSAFYTDKDRNTEAYGARDKQLFNFIWIFEYAPLKSDNSSRIFVLVIFMEGMSIEGKKKEKLRGRDWLMTECWRGKFLIKHLFFQVFVFTGIWRCTYSSSSFCLCS